VLAGDPTRPVGSWMAYDWNRRSYAEVMSAYGGPQ
jgi:hypothetical protein